MLLSPIVTAATLGKHALTLFVSSSVLAVAWVADIVPVDPFWKPLLDLGVLGIVAIAQSIAIVYLWKSGQAAQKQHADEAKAREERLVKALEEFGEK